MRDRGHDPQGGEETRDSEKPRDLLPRHTPVNLPGPRIPGPKYSMQRPTAPLTHNTRPHGPQTLGPMAPGHATPRPTPLSIRLHSASVPENRTPEHSTPRPHGPTAPKNPTRRSLAPECTVQGPADRKTSPRNQEHPPHQAAYAAHEAPALLPPRARTRPGVGNARSEAALSPLLWTAAAGNPHQKRAFL